MRANLSPLQFFGLIATVSALACGVYTDAAVAGTTVSTTESSGASASLVPVGTSSAPEAGPPRLVDATRTTVDTNGASRPLAASSPPPRLALAVDSHEWGHRRAARRALDSASDRSPAPRRRRRPRRRRPPRVLLAVTSESPRSSAAGTRQARPRAAPPHRRRNERPPCPSAPSVDSAGRTPVATRSMAGRVHSRSERRRRRPRRRPCTTPPTVTTAAPTEVPITRPATQPVADTADRDESRRDRFCRDRTCRDAAVQRTLGSRVPGQPRAEADPTPRLRGSVAPARQERAPRAALVTPTDAQPSPGPINPSRGRAAGHLGWLSVDRRACR